MEHLDAKDVAAETHVSELIPMIAFGDADALKTGVGTTDSGTDRWTLAPASTQMTASNPHMAAFSSSHASSGPHSSVPPSGSGTASGSGTGGSAAGGGNGGAGSGGGGGKDGSRMRGREEEEDERAGTTDSEDGSSSDVVTVSEDEDEGDKKGLDETAEPAASSASSSSASSASVGPSSRRGGGSAQQAAADEVEEEDEADYELKGQPLDLARGPTAEGVRMQEAMHEDELCAAAIAHPPPTSSSAVPQSAQFLVRHLPHSGRSHVGGGVARMGYDHLQELEGSLSQSSMGEDSLTSDAGGGDSLTCWGVGAPAPSEPTAALSHRTAFPLAPAAGAPPSQPMGPPPTTGTGGGGGGGAASTSVRPTAPRPGHVMHPTPGMSAAGGRLMSSGMKSRTTPMLGPSGPSVSRGPTGEPRPGKGTPAGIHKPLPSTAVEYPRWLLDTLQSLGPVTIHPPFLHPQSMFTYLYEDRLFGPKLKGIEAKVDRGTYGSGGLEALVGELKELGKTCHYTTDRDPRNGRIGRMWMDEVDRLAQQLLKQTPPPAAAAAAAVPMAESRLEPRAAGQVAQQTSESMPTAPSPPRAAVPAPLAGSPVPIATAAAPVAAAPVAAAPVAAAPVAAAPVAAAPVAAAPVAAAPVAAAPAPAPLAAAPVASAPVASAPAAAADPLALSGTDGGKKRDTEGLRMHLFFNKVMEHMQLPPWTPSEGRPAHLSRWLLDVEEESVMEDGTPPRRPYSTLFPDGTACTLRMIDSRMNPTIVDANSAGAPAGTEVHTSTVYGGGSESLKRDLLLAGEHFKQFVYENRMHWHNLWLAEAWAEGVEQAWQEVYSPCHGSSTSTSIGSSSKRGRAEEGEGGVQVPNVQAGHQQPPVPSDRKDAERDTDREGDEQRLSKRARTSSDPTHSSNVGTGAAPLGPAASTVSVPVVQPTSAAASVVQPPALTAAAVGSGSQPLGVEALIAHIQAEIKACEQQREAALRIGKLAIDFLKAKGDRQGGVYTSADQLLHAMLYSLDSNILTMNKQLNALITGLATAQRLVASARANISAVDGAAFQPRGLRAQVAVQVSAVHGTCSAQGQ